MAAFKSGLCNCKPHTERIFVYGTLMKGFRNYRRYLEGRINRIIPGKTYGLLYHLPEGYPALLPGNETVVGEIMEPVDKKLLKLLDRLEGYDELGEGNLYDRGKRKILTENGELECWIYVYTDERYARENGIPVPDGDWRKFITERRRNSK